MTRISSKAIRQERDEICKKMQGLMGTTKSSGVNLLLALWSASCNLVREQRKVRGSC